MTPHQLTAWVLFDREQQRMQAELNALINSAPQASDLNNLLNHWQSTLGYPAGIQQLKLRLPHWFARTTPSQVSKVDQLDLQLAARHYHKAVKAWMTARFGEGYDQPFKQPMSRKTYQSWFQELFEKQAPLNQVEQTSLMRHLVNYSRQ